MTNPPPSALGRAVVRSTAVLLSAVLLPAVAGCVGAPGGGDGTGVVPGTAAGPDCLQPSPAPASPPAPTSPTSPETTASPAASGSAAGQAAQGAAAMPALRLPCMHGGWTTLTALRGPALVNLWASWCAPCRAELPAIQRYAARAAGRVTVIGVATRDRSGDAAAALAEELGLTFPTLVDADGALLSALGRSALPVTLLVAPDGRIAAVHTGPAMDEAAIGTLVVRHLGVEVPA